MSVSKSYKQTEIGLLPEDWEVVKLEEITELKNGERPKIDEDGAIPIYGANGVMGRTNNYLVDSDFTMIFGRVGASGEIHLAMGRTWISDNAIYSENYKREAVNLPFLFYLLKFEDLKRFATKTTHPIITQTFLKNYRIPLPLIEEQKKIAEILSTVDEGIGKVDQAIDKTERLKKGLMHELLTKGIGHSSFKKTKLGKVPKEWGVDEAERVCAKVTDGTHDTPKPSELGYFLVTSKNLKEGKIDFSGCYSISRPDFEEVNKRSKVDDYDVLFGMIGTIGSPVLVDTSYPPFAIKNVGLFKTNRNRDLGVWLYYYLSSPLVARFVDRRLKGTTQKFVPLEFLRRLPIILPPQSERKAMSEILSAVDERLDCLRRRREKLKLVKKGLMNDLLTGKRRVKVAT